MKVIVNGETQMFEDESPSPTVTTIVEDLGYKPLIVVVELNGSILDSGTWDKQTIKNGDVLEIVTIVGGG